MPSLVRCTDQVSKSRLVCSPEQTDAIIKRYDNKLSFLLRIGEDFTQTLKNVSMTKWPTSIFQNTQHSIGFAIIHMILELRKQIGVERILMWLPGACFARMTTPLTGRRGEKSLDTRESHCIYVLSDVEVAGFSVCPNTFADTFVEVRERE